jgi:hypothetical protein
VLFIWATVSGAAAVVTGPRDVEVVASRGWQLTGARVEAGLRINDCDEGLSDNRGALTVRITN